MRYCVLVAPDPISQILSKKIVRFWLMNVQEKKFQTTSFYLLSTRMELHNRHWTVTKRHLIHYEQKTTKRPDGVITNIKIAFRNPTKFIFNACKTTLKKVLQCVLKTKGFVLLVIKWPTRTLSVRSVRNVPIQLGNAAKQLVPGHPARSVFVLCPTASLLWAIRQAMPGKVPNSSRRTPQN